MDNLTVSDTYFLKALDNYDYNIEEVVENLGYALSNDEEYAPAWCLQGRLMMEILKDYNRAIHCFEKAIFYDPLYMETYKHYSLLLIWIKDFDKAQIILNKSKRINGMPLSTIIYRTAMIHEYKGQIGEAIRIMNNGILFSLNQANYDFFDNEVKRLKRKVSKPKKKKKKVIAKTVKPTLIQLASKIIARLF